MTIFDVILLAHTLGSPIPVDPTHGVDFYYTAFKSGHQECLVISETTMLCPTNSLNRGITPSEQIDQEVQAWRVPAGCNELSDNVELCK